MVLLNPLGGTEGHRVDMDAACLIYVFDARLGGSTVLLLLCENESVIAREFSSCYRSCVAGYVLILYTSHRGFQWFNWGWGDFPPLLIKEKFT